MTSRLASTMEKARVGTECLRMQVYWFTEITKGTGQRKRTRKWRRRKRGFAVAKRRGTTKRRKRRLKQWRGSKSRRKRDLAGAVEEG